ncbi:ABC transporter permease [Brumimicrobium mesophilum]|uniref:ABC transporter permease n=1 Tax=Brumimicrobium mesophilum TaxID=392717 RepID=UPI000D14342F|nr:ABC transporter permease [Brumimicrobium mesophilum]
MKEYLNLQFILLNRKIDEIGLQPVMGYILAAALFFGSSLYLFSKTPYADYIYAFVVFGLISKLNNTQRIDFLKTVFAVNNYRKIRITENLIIAFPFLLYLIYEQSFIVSFVLIFACFFQSIFDVKSNLNFTLPTPFGKVPFEFPVGFRKTFLVFPIAYFITYQSIQVENFNLGIFSIFLITIVVFSFYAKPENEIYVWNFSCSPKQFIFRKIGTGIMFLSLLIFPTTASLLLFFQEEYTTTLFFSLLSLLYIIAMILAKYSVFPNAMNLPESILLLACVFFPPLLLAVIPLFYFKSITQLNHILKNDSN